MSTLVVCDTALACRLERAEANAGARFVEARARMFPDSGAQWIELGGVYAMYDGPQSPSTQTFGLGLFQVAAAAEMDRLEAFFTDRGAPVFHEVSPLAHKSTPGLLSERGYRPVDFTSVMFLPLAGRVPAAVSRDSLIEARPIAEADAEVWAATAAEGWREVTQMAGMMPDLMRLTEGMRGTMPFIATLGRQPIAAGALFIHDRVALFAGASTIPEWRKRGAQRALLESRLEYAAHAGCDLAMFCAEPGGSSQRNAERQGFRIAYTRIKWNL